MITLAIDTSFHYLTLVLYRDTVKLGAVQKEAFKQQSEIILDELNRLCELNGLKPTSIGEIVLTDGPGSYTGLRIGMTIAKIIGSLGNIPVYTLSSLQVLAGIQTRTAVVLDARAHRVYFAIYDQGLPLVEDCILNYDQALAQLTGTHALIGDGQLLGHEKGMPDYTDHFMQLRNFWKPVEAIHTLVPRYLKEHEGKAS